MPLLLVLIGAVLIVSGIRGTTGDLASNFASDIGTAGNGGVSFMVWVAAIVTIGAIGYIPEMQRVSRLLLALVVVVLLLKNGGGFFAQFVSQIEHVPAAAPIQPPGGNASLPAIPLQVTTAGTASGSGGTVSGNAASGISGALGGIIGGLL